MPSPAWLPAPMARIIITRQHGSNNFSNIGIACHHFGKACDQRTPADPPDKSQVMSNLASKVQLHRRFLCDAHQCLLGSGSLNTKYQNDFEWSWIGLGLDFHRMDRARGTQTRSDSRR